MVGFAIMSSISSAAGMGQHASDLTPEMFSNALFLDMIAEIFASLAIGVAKVAVSLLLMRIVVNKWYVSLTTNRTKFLLYY
jgi:hypothetical protein